MKRWNLKSMMLVLMALLFVSCSEKRAPISAEDVERLYSSGVVLIVNRYFYSLELENGVEFYFTGFDQEGNLDLKANIDEVSPTGCTGTGFFITADGQIATNSHVAYPDIDEKKVWAYIHTQGAAIKKLCNDHLRKYGDQISEEDQELLQNLITGSDYLSHADGTLTLHSMIGIAYNNTFIDNVSELYPCVGIKDSKKTDLAIIQLKSKQTPADRFVFNVELPTKPDGTIMPDKDGLPTVIDDLPIGTSLFMLGFNSSFSIGNTKEGIKAQLTQGDVSQSVDDIEFMYTIPSLQGSSGSPVLNEYGDLVGVNHAGWVTTQNFNYGIRVKHLRELFHQTAD